MINNQDLLIASATKLSADYYLDTLLEYNRSLHTIEKMTSFDLFCLAVNAYLAAEMDRIKDSIADESLRLSALSQRLVMTGVLINGFSEFARGLSVIINSTNLPDMFNKQT